MVYVSQDYMITYAPLEVIIKSPKFKAEGHTLSDTHTVNGAPVGAWVVIKLHTYNGWFSQFRRTVKNLDFEAHFAPIFSNKQSLGRDVLIEMRETSEKGEGYSNCRECKGDWPLFPVYRYDCDISQKEELGQYGLCYEHTMERSTEKFEACDFCGPLSSENNAGPDSDDDDSESMESYQKAQGPQWSCKNCGTTLC